jgi:two-component system response regulator AtoC
MTRGFPHDRVTDMGARTRLALIVDDATSERAELAAKLGRLGVTTVTSDDGAAALAILEARPVDLIIAGATLDDMTGVELVGQAAQRTPGIPVALVAPNNSVPEAVEALRRGAIDFLVHPVGTEQLERLIEHAFAVGDRHAEVAPSPPSATRELIGESPAMTEVHALVDRASRTTTTVLVRGESGTGKELVARALHTRSDRANGPFIKIDCASLPENLLESELFGYEKGAFTGAVSAKPGRVELANGGTLFLDEIGELSPPLQAKLLRLLQDRELERLGSTKTITVDLRIVAATHRDLETMVERGEFRQDLFYRLNVVPVWLPPLRTRRADIDALAQHFCQQFGRDNGRTVALTDAALKVLRRERWPGNVRQLQNFLERLVVLSDVDTLDAEHVKTELARKTTFKTQPSTQASTLGGGEGEALDGEAGPLDDAMRAAERRAIRRALDKARGNRTQAARLLGISRSTLYLKLDEHGLS